MSRADAMERMVESRQEATEVRSLLEAGIADDVGDYDFDKGLATHLAAVAAPPVGPGGASAAPAAAAAGLPLAASSAPSKALLIWIGAPLASLGVAAAVLFSHGRASAPAGVGSPNVSHASAPAAEPIHEASNTTGTDGLATGAEPPQHEATTDDDANSAASRTRRVARAAALPSTSSHGVSRTGAVVLAEDEPSRAAATNDRAQSGSGIVRGYPESEPAPATVAPSALPPKAAPTVSAHRSDEELARAEKERAESRRDADDKLQREMDELMRAKRALPSDPKLALELAQHGDREFPQGLLGEERRHVLLLALIGLGRVSEAEHLAAPYLAKHPDSPFAKRVRAALDVAKRHESH
jgi:hypothetical protein